MSATTEYRPEQCPDCGADRERVWLVKTAVAKGRHGAARLARRTPVGVMENHCGTDARHHPVSVRCAVKQATTLEDDNMPDTVQALIIPVDDAQPIRVEPLTLNPTAFQAVVGGWIEAVALRQPRATMYVNEEGKLKGLAVNRIATMLAWQHGHPTGDQIVGDCLIVGPPTTGGNDTDVPAAYVGTLTGGES